MTLKNIERMDYDSCITYAHPNGVFIANIVNHGERGAAGTEYEVLPNSRVCLLSLRFSAFGAAEKYVDAIAAETDHIDMCHRGRSPLKQS